MNNRIQKHIRRAACLTLIVTLLIPSAAFAKTDPYIFSDTVINTYDGRPEATQLISNLNFTDMPADASSQDAIVRSGVLNMIKSYERQYRPNASVTKEEAIAFALRAVGMENQAQAAGLALLATLPANSPLQTVWSVGYMSLAQNMGLITAAQYTDAINPDPSTLDPATNFVRTAAATREELAFWLATGLQNVNPAVFATTAAQQSIYAYTDWASIAPDKVNAVENLLRTNIMSGNGLSTFRPKGAVTRLETARILRNMDKIHYDTVGLAKKTGTVAGLADDQYNETAAGQLWRLVYVRGSDGKVDLIRYNLTGSSSPQDGSADAVTLREGTVAGLAALKEGDQIEYLVEPTTNKVWYVQVTGGLSSRTLLGRLQLADTTSGIITLTDDNGKAYTFPMANGLYGTDAGGSGYLIFNNVQRPVSTLAPGSYYQINVVNNIITSLVYMGEPEISPETRGIVTDNNPLMGYISLYDTNGREITKNYNTGSLRVQKTEYYDMRDTIGSIHSLFPDFQYNPRETDMSAIEPGDIVSFRTDPADSDRIVSISAATNYTTRYGRVREFRTDGDLSQMLMQFENGGTAWFSVADGIMIVKGGKPVSVAEIQPGDWARLLVNQAVIAPGYVLESVKEVMLEGDGHYISTIVKGKLAGINLIQNRLNLQDAQKLTGTGWSDYKQVNQYNIAGKNIAYYYDGKPVTLSYVNNYLSRTDASVYIALENNYAGETVSMVAIRSGRDELLKTDTVITTDGSGGFTTMSGNPIATDAGTIVRRNGRLVDGMQILAPDYAVVSINGGNTAAVVDITQAPATAGVMIARGRVYSVDQGKTFKVQSMSLFGGQSWSYTPIQREFSIDRDTLFMDANGLTAIDDFIGYTDTSVVDKVYNVVLDGSRATRVIDAPYATAAVRGTIYQTDGSGSLSLKDMQTYDPKTGKWSAISNRNATGTVTLPSNAIIIDRNQVVGANTLRNGQQLKIMTDTLPETIASGLSVTGYIVLVEN